jgi:hypothetical protein
MNLSDHEIAQIAEWEPIRAGFGRGDGRTALRIQGIMDEIKSSGDFGCDLLEDDGLSNYYMLFAFALADVPNPFPARQMKGLLIYLSTCAPVCVVGRKMLYRGFSVDSHLSIDVLISPDQADGQTEHRCFQALRDGGYEVLSAEEVAKPLPPGVTPYEYFHGPKPWDRVFHALFANSD